MFLNVLTFLKTLVGLKLSAYLYVMIIR